MNSKAVILLIMTLSVKSLFAQELSSWIDNNTFKYKIVRVSLQLKTEEKAVPSKYLIKAELPENARNDLKKLTKKEWLALLSNDKSDWAANLFLYDLFERDAFLFNTTKNREQWCLSLKQKDIDFWKKKLKE